MEELSFSYDSSVADVGGGDMLSAMLARNPGMQALEKDSSILPANFPMLELTQPMSISEAPFTAHVAGDEFFQTLANAGIISSAFPTGDEIARLGNIQMIEPSFREDLGVIPDRISALEGAPIARSERFDMQQAIARRDNIKPIYTPEQLVKVEFEKGDARTVHYTLPGGHDYIDPAQIRLTPRRMYPLSSGGESSVSLPSSSKKEPAEEKGFFETYTGVDIIGEIKDTETYKEYVAPAVEKLTSAVDFVVEQPSTKPSVESTPEVKPSETPQVDLSNIPKATIPEDLLTKKPSIPDTSLEDAVLSVETSVDVLEGVTGGKIYPVTDAEQAQASLDYLNEVGNPDGKTDGDNELIAKYFWYLVPGLSQSGANWDKLSTVARDYESLYNGDIEAVNKYSNDNAAYALGFTGNQRFEDLSEPQQKLVIREFNEAMIDSDISPVCMAMFNSGLSASTKSTSTENNINKWMDNGGLKQYLKDDGYWYYTSGASDWLESPQGMAAVGVGFNVAATVGAFMVSGPAGAVVTMATYPYSATELYQLFGEQAFKTKGELQLSGEYAQDHVGAYDKLFTAARDTISNVQYASSKNDPSVNKANIAVAEQAIENLGKELKKKYVYLKAANVYENKVLEYEILKGNLEAKKTMFNEEGIQINKDGPASPIQVINTDKTWTITYGEMKLRADGKGKLGETKQNIVGDVTITDKDGNVIGVKSLSVYGGGNGALVDAAAIVREYQAKQAYATGTSKTANNPADDRGELQLLTSPTTRVWVDGKEFRPSGNKNIVPVVPGYYLVKTQKSDGTVEEKRVFVGKNSRLAVSDHATPAKSTYTKSSSSGSGGGGGGGSSSGSSKTESKPVPKPTYIKYGAAINGCRVFLDDHEEFPIPELNYDLSVGNHIIRIEKPEWNPWFKEFMAKEGDTIGIYPMFTKGGTPASGSGGSSSGGSGTTGTLSIVKSRTVYINSEPYGAKVLVNGGSIGEWTPCKVELPYGYYTIGILKSGYETLTYGLLVGDYILQGDQATSTAKDMGLI